MCTSHAQVEQVYRYQYLELAFFLTYGHCPDQEPSEYGYILSERAYMGWDQFFKNSSDVLNVDTPPRHTREICLCSRTRLLPRLVTERRQFIYDDIEVNDPSHVTVTHAAVGQK